MTSQKITWSCRTVEDANRNRGTHPPWGLQSLTWLTQSAPSRALTVPEIQKSSTPSHEHVIRVRPSSPQQHTSSHHVFLSQMRGQDQQDINVDNPASPRHLSPLSFDNSDEESSQPGMENYAQITMTGRSVLFFLSCVSWTLNTLISYVVIAIGSLSPVSKYLLNRHRISYKLSSRVSNSISTTQFPDYARSYHQIVEKNRVDVPTDAARSRADEGWKVRADGRGSQGP